MHDGVVLADSNEVINLSAEGADPVSQRDTRPDDRERSQRLALGRHGADHHANGQLNNLANYYTPFWRTAMPGRVSVTNGSSTITGNGTNLQLPCGGNGSAPLSGASFILHYLGADSRDHYTVWPIVSCNSATSLTIGGSYPAGPNYPWDKLPQRMFGFVLELGLRWRYAGA